MGHTNGLDGTYLQITPDRLFEEFYKGITDLSVSSHARDQIKIRKLEKTIPDDHEIITQIMPKIMQKIRDEFKITEKEVDTMNSEQLKNLIKNFLVN